MRKMMSSILLWAKERIKMNLKLVETGGLACCLVGFDFIESLPYSHDTYFSKMNQFVE